PSGPFVAAEWTHRSVLSEAAGLSAPPRAAAASASVHRVGAYACLGMHLGTVVGSHSPVAATWGPNWRAGLATRLRPSAFGEWLGEGPRPGRPIQVRSFMLSTFAVQDERVVAVGTLSAVLMTAAGPGVDTSVVTSVALPVGLQQTSDETLRLDIGPIAVDLLGLQVNLSQMTL